MESSILHIYYVFLAFSLRKSTAQIQVSAAKSLSSRFLFTKSNGSLYGSSRTGGQRGEPAQKPSFLFKDTYRRKMFKYEKRIRTRSPPEKVFEYFASYKSSSGEQYMTAADLMRAVVPIFPPSEAEAVRGGYLNSELITNKLYIFFVTILSIPESSFPVAFKMFDIDNDGNIDKQEFKKVMSLTRSQNRQGAPHRGGKRIGLEVSGSVENVGLLEYFGNDGNECLEYEKFVQFLRNLHDEVCHKSHHQRIYRTYQLEHI